MTGTRKKNDWIAIYPYKRHVEYEDPVFESHTGNVTKETMRATRYEFEIASPGRKNRILLGGGFNESLEEAIKTLKHYIRKIKAKRITIYQNENSLDGIGYSDPVLGKNLENVSMEEYQAIVKWLLN